MGRERDCNATWDGSTTAGRLFLETDELIFRGERRLKIPFRDVLDVRAASGVLHVRHAKGAASFEIGDDVKEWAERILKPKGRIEKLGVTAASTVRLVGIGDAAFPKEVADAGATATTSTTADLVFLGATAAADLRKVATHAKSLRGAQALWIVYPKGRTDITEAMVIEAGRRAGLKDVKVVRFSETHTALKFVLPKDAR